ncbi:MAG: uracil-DNA glycosylase [Pseudomonadota bacterium]
MIEPLDERRRRDYLDALDIDVWLPTAAACAVDDEQPADAAPQNSVAKRKQSAPVSSSTAQQSTLAAEGGAAHTWDLLQRDVTRCTQCRLHETRTQAVFGVGDRHAKLMIVGEAPGAEEDRRGEPFVGRAGQLLDAMLHGIGISREQVFITNTLKCRPPQNRDPRNDEMSACAPYLADQIAQVAPSLILAVGRIAAQKLLAVDRPLGKLRGDTHQLPGSEIPVIVTYHPAYLLRTPAQKALAWQDLKRVHARLAES